MINPKEKFKEELIHTARAIVRPGHGLLAADESTGTIKKRFDDIKVENTEENRRFYRELLITTKDMEKYISGIIMYEETVDQKDANGKPFMEILKEKGVIPGIKLDKGTVKISGTKGEFATQGLDGLAERAASFYAKGCKFTKWRAVVQIGDGIPTELCIKENAHTLARYASICQDNGLMPIVEPEIMVDGDHSLAVACEVAEKTISETIKAL